MMGDSLTSGKLGFLVRVDSRKGRFGSRMIGVPPVRMLRVETEASEKWGYKG